MTDQNTIDRVQQAVSDRQNEAFGKKLDLLFSTAYHECIESFPMWNLNEHRRYIYPSIVDVWEGEDKKAIRHTTFIEFKIKGTIYKITQEFRVGQGKEDFHNYELFRNDELVFALSESYRVEDGITQYTTMAISAFVNEEWVPDFEAIKKYYTDMLRDGKSTERNAIDPAELRKHFSIPETHMQEEKTRTDKKRKIVFPVQHDLVWIGLAILILILALVTALF